MRLLKYEHVSLRLRSPGLTGGGGDGRPDFSLEYFIGLWGTEQMRKLMMISWSSGGRVRSLEVIDSESDIDRLDRSPTISMFTGLQDLAEDKTALCQPIRM